MKKSDVVKGILESGVFYLTTVDDGKPKVRPYGFLMEYNGKICFTTNKNKPTYSQLISNPYVEICAMQSNMSWIRLSGKAVNITSDDSRKSALEAMPALAQNYAVYGGDFDVFGLDEAVADYYSFGGESGIRKTSYSLDKEE